MKKIFFVLLVALVIIPSCKKDEPVPSNLPCTPYAPEREFYFTGVVLEECRCLQEGQYHYQASKTEIKNYLCALKTKQTVH